MSSQYLKCIINIAANGGTRYSLCGFYFLRRREDHHETVEEDGDDDDEREERMN